MVTFEGYWPEEEKQRVIEQLRNLPEPLKRVVAGMRFFWMRRAEVAVYTPSSLRYYDQGLLGGGYSDLLRMFAAYDISGLPPDTLSHETAHAANVRFIPVSDLIELGRQIAQLGEALKKWTDEEWVENREARALRALYFGVRRLVQEQHGPLDQSLVDELIEQYDAGMQALSLVPEAVTKKRIPLAGLKRRSWGMGQPLPTR